MARGESQVSRIRCCDFILSKDLAKALPILQALFAFLAHGFAAEIEAIATHFVFLPPLAGLNVERLLSPA